MSSLGTATIDIVVGVKGIQQGTRQLMNLFQMIRKETARTAAGAMHLRREMGKIGQVNTGELTKGLRSSRTAMQSFGKEANASLTQTGYLAQQAGVAIAALGTAILGTLTLVTKIGAEFEQAFTNAASIAFDFGDGIGVVRAQSESLETSIRDLAKATEFTAVEIANASQQLALAGFSGQEIVANLDSIVNLASATNTELSETAKIVARISRAFDIDATGIKGLADDLTAVATNANVTLASLGEAFKKVAPIAAAFRLNIQDVNAAIGVLGDAGIEGSIAGTGLSRFITEVTEKRAELEEFLNAVGRSFDEIDLSKNDLEDVVRVFEELIDAGQVSGDIAFQLFDQRSARAFTSLVNQGADAVARLRKEQEDSANINETIRNFRLDTITGQFKILVSQLTEFAIAVTESFAQPLTQALSVLGSFVSALSRTVAASPKVTAAIVAVAAGIGALTLALGAAVAAAGTFIIVMSAVNAAVVLSGGTALTAAGAFTVMWAAITGPVGAVLAVIALVVAALAGIAAQAGLVTGVFDVFTMKSFVETQNDINRSMQEFNKLTKEANTNFAKLRNLASLTKREIDELADDSSGGFFGLNAFEKGTQVLQASLDTVQTDFKLAEENSTKFAVGAAMAFEAIAGPINTISKLTTGIDLTGEVAKFSREAIGNLQAYRDEELKVRNAIAENNNKIKMAKLAYDLLGKSVTGITATKQNLRDSLEAEERERTRIINLINEENAKQGEGSAQVKERLNQELAFSERRAEKYSEALNLAEEVLKMGENEKKAYEENREALKSNIVAVRELAAAEIARGNQVDQTNEKIRQSYFDSAKESEKLFTEFFKDDTTEGASKFFDVLDKGTEVAMSIENTLSSISARRLEAQRQIKNINEAIAEKMKDQQWFAKSGLEIASMQLEKKKLEAQLAREGIDETKQLERRAQLAENLSFQLERQVIASRQLIEARKEDFKVQLTESDLDDQILENARKRKEAIDEISQAYKTLEQQAGSVAAVEQEVLDLRADLARREADPDQAGSEQVQSLRKEIAAKERILQIVKQITAEDLDQEEAMKLVNQLYDQQFDKIVDIAGLEEELAELTRKKGTALEEELRLIDKKLEKEQKSLDLQIKALETNLEIGGMTAEEEKDTNKRIKLLKERKKVNEQIAQDEKDSAKETAQEKVDAYNEEVALKKAIREKDIEEEFRIKREQALREADERAKRAGLEKASAEDIANVEAEIHEERMKREEEISGKKEDNAKKQADDVAKSSNKVAEESNNIQGQILNKLAGQVTNLKQAAELMAYMRRLQRGAEQDAENKGKRLLAAQRKQMRLTQERIKAEAAAAADPNDMNLQRRAQAARNAEARGLIDLSIKGGAAAEAMKLVTGSANSLADAMNTLRGAMPAPTMPAGQNPAATPAGAPAGAQPINVPTTPTVPTPAPAAGPTPAATQVAGGSNNKVINIDRINIDGVADVDELKAELKKTLQDVLDA